MIKVAWFKAGKTVENGTSHQGVFDANKHIETKGIQKQDVLGLQYILLDNVPYYILTYKYNDSKTVL